MAEQVKTKVRRGADRRKRKFNFLDGIIILLFILVAVFTVNFFSPSSTIIKWRSDNVKSITYTVELLGVDEDFINLISEGNAVIDSVTKHPLGSVTAVDYNTNHGELRPNPDPTNVEGIISRFDDKFDVIVTITADATYTKGKGYFISDKQVIIGEKMYLRFLPDFVGEGYCISISEVN